MKSLSLLDIAFDIIVSVILLSILVVVINLSTGATLKQAEVEQTEESQLLHSEFMSYNGTNVNYGELCNILHKYINEHGMIYKVYYSANGVNTYSPKTFPNARFNITEKYWYNLRTGMIGGKYYIDIYRRS